MLVTLHREGATVLMVTHSEDRAARAERIVHLRDGRIVPATRSKHARPLSRDRAAQPAPRSVHGIINVRDARARARRVRRGLAVVADWNHSDRHFSNAARTFVITASLALRDGSISTGNMPQTNDLYQKYMRLEFPEFEAIVRANPWSKTASVTADGRRARVVAVAVDPEFLDIFDLPFIAGDPHRARDTTSVLLSEAAAVRLAGTRDVLGKTISLGGNRIDATVTGVIAKIPEPSHLGSARSASLNFEMIAPWDLYDRLRQSFNTPPTPPPAAKPSDASATPTAADGSKPPAGDKAADKSTAGAAAPDAAPPDSAAATERERLGGYCCDHACSSATATSRRVHRRADATSSRTT